MLKQRIGETQWANRAASAAGRFNGKSRWIGFTLPVSILGLHPAAARRCGTWRNAGRSDMSIRSGDRALASPSTRSSWPGEAGCRPVSADQPHRRRGLSPFESPRRSQVSRQNAAR